MFPLSLVKDKGLRIKDCARSSRRARGFTLLFAVLIGSLLFSLGLAVSHVALREVVLAAAGKESERAFYAADAGSECALYFDLRVGGTFPDSSSAPRRASVACAGGTSALTVVSETGFAATTTFRLSLASQCADVAVGKVKPQGRASGRTVIESRGRNDCGEGDNPARVERALRVRY
ncbi:MAG: hypothetical protein AAB699_03720 [Patescibacteria group bacterium]